MKQNAGRKNTQSKKAVREVASPNLLADLFRQHRVNAAKSISEVADDAGVSEATIRLLETAPQKVPLHDVYAVSNVLNLDPGLVLELLHAAIR